MLLMVQRRSAAPPAVDVARALPSAARGQADGLEVGDYRRALVLLEACEVAGSPEGLRRTLVDAAPELLGHRHIAVFFTGDPRAGDHPAGPAVASGALAGLEAVYPQHRHDDPLLTAAALRRLTSTGHVGLDDVASTLTAAHRRFLTDLFASRRVQPGFAVWLDTRLPVHAVIGVHDDAHRPRLTDRDRALWAAVLRPHLANLLTGLLARGNWELPATQLLDLPLTPREREVAGLAAQALSNRQIARRLGVGEDTVKKHMTRILAATGTTSRTQLALLLTRSRRPVR